MMARRMTRSQLRLGEEKDPGAVTQVVQAKILKELDRLIDEASKNLTPQLVTLAVPREQSGRAQVSDLDDPQLGSRTVVVRTDYHTDFTPRGGAPGSGNRAAIQFDSRLEPTGWQTVGFDDSGWAGATAVDAARYATSISAWVIEHLGARPEPDARLRSLLHSQAIFPLTLSNPISVPNNSFQAILLPPV